MVLPKPGKSGGIVLPFIREGQRNAFFINRNRCRACRVYANAYDVFGFEITMFGGLSQRVPNRLLQAFKIVGWILPRKIMIVWVEDYSLMTGWIIKNRSPQFLTVSAIDNQSTDRIRAIINT